MAELCAAGFGAAGLRDLAMAGISSGSRQRLAPQSTRRLSGIQVICGFLRLGGSSRGGWDIVISADHAPSTDFAFGVGVSGEGAGPGDVAMADFVQVVRAFAKDPARAFVAFAQGEEVGGDVLLASGEALPGGGELLHEREAEIVLFAAEVDGNEAAAEMAGGIPADLPAQSGGIARSFERAQFGEEFVFPGFLIFEF